MFGTIAQIVALHAVGHQTKEIMDSTEEVGERLKLKAAMILPHTSIGLNATKRLVSMLIPLSKESYRKILVSQQEKYKKITAECFRRNL